MARAQRRLSRKKKGSKNRNKQRILVAKVYERISNVRNDFLHKISTRLVRENQTIGIEDLQVSNMMKNHKLARAISDVSWAEFFRMLEYKAVIYGTDVIRVPTFYPSSQICSVCGERNMETKNFGLTETDFLQLFVEYNSRNPNYRHILRTDSTTNKMNNNKINRIPIPDTLIFGEANSIYNVKYYKYASTIEKLFLFLGQVIRYDPYLNLFVIVT